MRAIFIHIAIILILLSYSQGTEEVETEIEYPNIVLIIADDLGWEDIGYNGQDKIETPIIDQLANEGMIFNRMYSGSPVCGPSRVSLFTGKHTGHSSVRGNPKWSSSGLPVDLNSDKYKESYRSKDWPLREMKQGHYLHDKNGHVTYASMVSNMDSDIGRVLT